jgi:hypothetical protein
MSIQVRVRVTSKLVVNDVKVQYQRHRTLCIREVVSQLDVPTLLTLVPSHMLEKFLSGFSVDT